MSYPVFPAAISGKGVGGDPWPDGGPLGGASGCSAAATTIFGKGVGGDPWPDGGPLGGASGCSAAATTIFSERCPEFTGALS